MLKKLLSAFQNQSILWFLSGMLIFGITIGLFNGSLNHFLHDILKIDKAGRGIIEFPRETPGLLLILLLAFLYRFAEIKIMKVAFLTAVLGMAGLFFFGTRLAPAVFFIMLWSAGEHLMMPVRSSVAVHLAKPGREGAALGLVRSIGNIGTVTGFGIVSLVFYFRKNTAAGTDDFTDYRLVFLITIIILVFAFAVISRIPGTQAHIKRKRLYLAKQYWRYYILEVLFGARKQIFLTFAPYVLIIHYNVKTELLALLYLAAHILTIFIGPLTGKLIDRIGFRVVIIADTVFLFILCLLYGFTHHIVPQAAAFPVIAGVFILDSVLFVVGMARTMFVKSLSRSQEETTSTLSTGLSINHLISILIAVGGGILWKKTGIEILFSAAALFALGSFAFSLTLPGVKKR